MKIGLVFSGGGVRALAHAGLLKALEEKGLRPSIISGTSGGALIGGLYACGIAPDDMLSFFKETPVFKWSMLTFKKVGLVDSSKTIQVHYFRATTIALDSYSYQSAEWQSRILQQRRTHTAPNSLIGPSPLLLSCEDRRQPLLRWRAAEQLPYRTS